MKKQRADWRLVFLGGLAACATNRPPVADAASLPWLVRHMLRGWDGGPIEVLGAPGPRAVAAFLSLAMEHSGASRPEDLGDVLNELPSFYQFHFERIDSGSGPEAHWIVRASDLHDPIEWQGDDEESLPRRTELFRSYSLSELAVALNDVEWKWPRRPGSRSFLRPPLSPEFLGKVLTRLLRKMLDRGMTLERAWEELRFQHRDDLYVLTLLSGERLRVSWHPEVATDDWPLLTPWVGNY